MFTSGGSGKNSVQQKCEDDVVGGGLVTIRNQDQQDFVENEIKRTANGKTFSYLTKTSRCVHCRFIYFDIDFS